jgi:hypothetical protein
MSAETAVQGAVYARLGGSSLGVNGIYDTAPQAADGGDTSAFPYVTMGRMIFTESDTWETTGFAAQIRIHTFSRSGSMLEARTIQGKIYDALHKSELTVSGFNNVSLLREDSDCFADQDGKIHGVCEYRALIESA